MKDYEIKRLVAGLYEQGERNKMTKPISLFDRDELSVQEQLNQMRQYVHERANAAGANYFELLVAQGELAAKVQKLAERLDKLEAEPLNGPRLK